MVTVPWDARRQNRDSVGDASRQTGLGLTQTAQVSIGVLRAAIGAGPRV